MTFIDNTTQVDQNLFLSQKPLPSARSSTQIFLLKIIPWKIMEFVNGNDFCDEFK